MVVASIEIELVAILLEQNTDGSQLAIGGVEGDGLGEGLARVDLAASVGAESLVVDIENIGALSSAIAPVVVVVIRVIAGVRGRGESVLVALEDIHFGAVLSTHSVRVTVVVASVSGV